MKYNFSDKKTRTKAWVAIISIPTIVACFVFYESYQLDHYRQRTIGQIIKKQPYKYGYDIKAKFTVNNYDYVSYYSYSSKNSFLDSVKMGDTVYVEYSSQDPLVNEIIFK